MSTSLIFSFVFMPFFSDVSAHGRGSPQILFIYCVHLSEPQRHLVFMYNTQCQLFVGCLVSDVA